MALFFSWKQNPEIAEFVFSNFTGKGSVDLARIVSLRWGVDLKPGQIRDYCRHRRTREDLEDKGVDAPVCLAEQAAVLESPGARWPDKREPWKPSDAEELYRSAMEECERKEATSLAQTHLTVNRSSEVLPVGVCFWSDWQVGTSGVMMRQLLEDAETIRDAEGLYTFLMGDLIQNLNMVKHPSSLHECVLPDPRDQQNAARWIMDIANQRAKIEGLVDGNHEGNSKKAAGFCLGEAWSKELKVPYLWHGAKVTYRVGKVDYILGLRHKFRNESGINTTNVQRTIHQQLWPDADVVVLGHRHYNDLQQITKPLKTTAWLRAGSYQKWDEFGQSAGHYKGAWGIPLVILYPDERKVVPIYGENFHTGLEILQDVRDRYRKKL